MRVTIATDPAPGHLNEDFAAATANATVLLDGAGLSDVDDGGCIHGVAWYTRHLGGELLARMLDQPAADLASVLGEAISTVTDSHRTTCDINHPGTPSSTVIMVNSWNDVLHYLVLADSVLVINEHDQRQVICDDREATVGRQHRRDMDAQPGGTTAHRTARRAYVETLRSYRNRPGGFWVAAGTPDAASHAITGQVETETIQSVLLLSDGASRLVDRFKLSTWDETTRLILDSGCEALLRAVRGAEYADPQGQRWPRGKIHDDATVVLCEHI
jgi:hypothetical protein